IQIADSKGADYSGSIAYSTFSPALATVAAGRRVAGTFTFNHGVDRDASVITLSLKEDGGGNRIFALTAHRLVE
ncbi:MAG: hypothetical protein KGR26_09720, partial [Cyanobacteria bacterium REEB65]|nr:hypothetical protein [Cyanobacteria bacterium REEB65]